MMTLNFYLSFSDLIRESRRANAITPYTWITRSSRMMTLILQFLLHHFQTMSFSDLIRESITGEATSPLRMGNHGGLPLHCFTWIILPRKDDDILFITPCS